MEKNLSETKESLIAEIRQREQEKILEPENAALLVKLITNAENDDDARAIAALGTTYKRTGFHFDKRLEKHVRTDTIKYFVKNEALSFGEVKEGKPVHKLIIGDNYDALNNLLIQYRKGVDVIYIDPPYGKDSLGEYAKTNYENSINRDNLLSMLYFRLQIAKQLLSDDGVIFCSIDDKNQAYVKCLFDEIFGEKNFLICFPKKGAGAKQDSTHFAKIHEYVLCYAKKKDNYTSGKISVEKNYPQYDESKQLYYKTQLLRKWGDASLRKDRPNMFFPLFYNPSKKTLSVDFKSKDDIEIYPMLDNETEGRWRWGKESVRDGINAGLIEIVEKKGSYIAYERIYAQPDDETTKLYSSWIDDVVNSTGKALLKSIGVPFDYPKPMDLIDKVLQMANNKTDGIILDFFAGSGTTGHAVLDLNNTDGGKRTFILCQLNEVTDSTPNGIAYDVTSKRLKRIMTGECYDGSKDFKWAEENEPYGGKLEVYEIKEVSNSSAIEGKTPFDVIDETLYGREKFKTAKEKIEWVCSNFSHTQMVESKNE